MSAVVEELRQSQLEVTQLRGEVQSREVELERLNKDIALAREREASLLEDRCVCVCYARGSRPPHAS